MSSIEQSLDAIIAKDRAANKKPRAKPLVGKKPAAKRVGGKIPTTPRAKLINKAVAGNDALPTTTKVMVSGMPKDITPPAIKEFFNSQVGQCQTVHLAYNAQGKSTGNATILFKTAKAAKAAVAKYQGAPIDGGKSRLTLELVIDPSRRSLASRIVANKPMAAKMVQKKLKKAPATKAGKNIRAKRPAKKTLEQLDAEMADYFSKNE